MTHSPSWKPPTLTASSEKYAKLIHDSTQQLHQAVEPIMSALNGRAMGFAKCVNYESAFRDAHLMQQLSPYSALGYLCEASIYSEQGKQLQVIDVCNKGLSRIDTSDTHCATLLQVKIDAKQRQDTRIDFISQLPNDIVISTLIPMIMGDNLVVTSIPCPYLQVTSLWNERIIECFNGLRFMVVDDDDMSQVIQFAQHTKTLHVSHYAEGTWLGDLIGGKAFSSLQGIKISHFWSDHIDHFVSSLQHVSSTLADVQMNMEDGPGLRASDIIMVCPNLISLSISEALDGDLTSLGMTTWPAMTTLSLDFTCKPITYEQIIGMWKRFPALRRLTLSPCTGIQSTLVVSEYCPSINRLDVWMDECDLTLTFSDDGNDGHGITKLTIGETDYEYDTCKDTTSIIKQHHNTLEHLEWDMYTYWDTETIDDLHFPCLKVLRAGFSGWQIPRNAPLLEELKLTSKIIRTQPAVLDMIPPRLKKLALILDDDIEEAEPVDPPVIVHYLDRIAQQLQLYELAFHFDNEQQNIADMLDAIYHHHHLECLKISFTEDLHTYEMESFLDGLVESCPRLDCLELKCARAPSIHAINTLKQLERLTQFRFPVFGTDDADRFWNAIRTFTQLKCITIYPACEVKDEHVKYLKQHRPDMEIGVETFTVHF